MDVMKAAEASLKARRRRRALGLWRDSIGPILVSSGIAVVEQISLQWPQLPEPAMLLLAFVALTGFVTTVNSAVLSSLICVAYCLVFVAERHELHGDHFPICVEAILLAVAAPAIAITGATIRRNALRAAESLRKHLSNTPLGVIELDSNCEVSLWAGSAASIFGLTEKDAVGRSIFELPGIFFEEDDAVQVRLLLEQLEAGLRTKAVLQTRRDSGDGEPGHSRWFWSTALEGQGGRARFLILVEDITDRVRVQLELEASKTELIERLVRASEHRDDSTGAHVSRMARYCEALARAKGWSDEMCEMLLLAAPMHDIGKIGIPDHILLKPGPLTADEFEIMKTHARIGAEILSGSSNELVRMAEQIALSHHERWDGKGYPNGLSGEEIPEVGRICAVCDVFDALTSDRPYKRAWTTSEAVAELRKLTGSALDPSMVESFLSILPEIEAIRRQYVLPGEDDVRRAA